MIGGKLARRFSEQVEGSPLVRLRVALWRKRRPGLRTRQVREGDEGALAEGCAPEDEARRAVVFVRAIVSSYNGQRKKR